VCAREERVAREGVGRRQFYLPVLVLLLTLPPSLIIFLLIVLRLLVQVLFNPIPQIIFPSFVVLTINTLKQPR
jgi:uncharacterized BrkB/YihY/UPF0761 family membrane protein